MAVEHFQSGTFVEIGCFKGGSTVYLASRIQMAKKDIKLYAVDIWENMIAPGTPGSVFYDFWHHVMVHYGHQTVKPIQFDSSKTARLFDDNSVEFVFIDGDHSYEGVRKDILAWMPKIRRGGAED
jgi:predicted O-methyltransferase YrrM